MKLTYRRLNFSSLLLYQKLSKFAREYLEIVIINKPTLEVLLALQRLDMRICHPAQEIGKAQKLEREKSQICNCLHMDA